MVRTIEERMTIVRLFSKYDYAHEVQRQWKRHFNMSPSALATITSVNQRFNITESVEGLPRTDRSATVLIEKRI